MFHSLLKEVQKGHGLIVSPRIKTFKMAVPYNYGYALEITCMTNGTQVECAP